MYSFDVSVTGWINGLAGQSTGLDALLVWVSSFGVPLLVAAVAVQWWPAVDRARFRHVLVSSGLSFILGLLLNQIILLALHRVRPYDVGVSHLLIAPSADPSFPSDHATAAFAIAAAFILHGLHRRGLGFLAAAFLIAFSRVYLGIHYASDVAGGALTGIAAALAVVKFYPQASRLNRFLTGIL